MELVHIGPGRELFIEQHNPEASKVLVLLHGLGSSHLYWSSALARSGLSSAGSGWRTIAVDLHGHGRSPLASAPDAEVSIGNYAEDVRLLLDKLGITSKIALVGHSMSGLIVSTFAATYPDRISKLVLLGAIRTLPEAGKQGMRDRAAKARSGQLGSVALAISQGAISKSSKEKPLVGEIIRALVEGTDPEGYARAAEAIASAQEPELSKISAETLVIGGEEDYMANEQVVDALVQGIKNAKKHVMKGIGHWQAVEDPDAVGQLLVDFLGTAGKDE